MKKALLICLASLILTRAAFAGHGTIVETETGFVVEYSGEPGDKGGALEAKQAPPKEAPQVQDAPQRPATPQVAATLPTGEPRPVPSKAQRRKPWRERAQLKTDS